MSDQSNTSDEGNTSAEIEAGDSGQTAAPGPETPKRIGILVVHGIGEQKRFETLTSAVRDLSEHLRRARHVEQVSVIDRLADFKDEAPDAPSLDKVPLTINARVDNDWIAFECHEVWWADLDAKGGLWQQIQFWIWGLGQWLAPLYAESPTQGGQKMIRPSFGDSPRAWAWRCPSARLSLFLAALMAFFTFFTWSLMKKVWGFLAKNTPSASLIYSYLGDVKTYQERARPGYTPLTDPGKPLRVAIRRRMVHQMVAMAERQYERWYIFAHSLGSVVAFNGLMESDHALPNYLTEEQWASTPGRLKHNNPRTPGNIDNMWPARPHWLNGTDAISRDALFKQFKGLVTYGSPLDKFAMMWPQVVTINPDPAPLHGNAAWLNFYDPTDPVGASLDAFDPKKAVHNSPDGYLPHNYACKSDWKFGVSHIEYLTPREDGHWAARLIVAMARGNKPLADAVPGPGEGQILASAWPRTIFSAISRLLVGIALALAAGGVLYAAQKLVDKALSTPKTVKAMDVTGFPLADNLGRLVDAGDGKTVYLVIALGLAVSLAIMSTLLCGLFSRMWDDRSNRRFRTKGKSSGYMPAGLMLAALLAVVAATVVWVNCLGGGHWTVLTWFALVIWLGIASLVISVIAIVIAASIDYLARPKVS